MSENNSIIKLNLRGTRFETLSSTLSKDSNSLLGQMMNPDYPLKPMQTQDGYYFFDRSPACFEVILDFLSQGFLEEKIPERELLKLEKEAKFFKLTKLENEITARLLQIQTEEQLRLNEKNNDVKKECDVIKINVSGTIFQLTKSTLNKYPDSLLAQYVKGTNEPMRDIDGNIYLEKNLDTYTYIMNCLKNGQNDVGHRTELVSRDINFLWSVKQEAEFLNLTDLSEHIDWFLYGRFNEFSIVVNFKDGLLRVKDLTPNPHETNSTLQQRVNNSGKVLKEKNGLFFMDISNEEMNLLITKWEKQITRKDGIYGNHKDDPVTVLARKLGFIKDNETLTK